MIEDCEVFGGEAAGRRDAVEEGRDGVVGGHPVPIGVGDLVVDPDVGPLNVPPLLRVDIGQGELNEPPAIAGSV